MKTVRVRIAVAVGSDKHWSSAGWEGADDETKREVALANLDSEQCCIHWIEADVPLPEPQTIPGVVRSE